MQSIFLGVLNYLLPENKRIALPEIRSDVMHRTHVLHRIRDSEQNLYDEIESTLQEQLDENPRSYSAERLHEIRCLLRLVKESPANFLLVCMERFQVCDESGRVVDEWDGAMLEIYRNKVVLKVLEAKAGGIAAQRERDALIQLRETRKLMRSRHSISYRTKRIQGMGAVIEFTVPTI